MKHFANLVELAIVLTIIYPVYYIWATERVDNFCEQVQPGISRDELLSLAEDRSINLQGPYDIDDNAGIWMATVDLRASFSGYACVIRGAGDIVASAEITEK